MFDKLLKNNEDNRDCTPEESNDNQQVHANEDVLTPSQAQDYWAKIASKIIVSATNCVDHMAERIFILISFDEKMPTMDIFFQMNGQIRMWNDLDNPQQKKVIYQSLLPQAVNVVKQVHNLYDRADVTRIAYSQIQFEFESKTWYLHDISQASMEAQLDKEAAFLKWFDDVSREIKNLAVDSEQKITWGPFKPLSN
jgi:hypothetical protein